MKNCPYCMVKKAQNMESKNYRINIQTVLSFCLQTPGSYHQVALSTWHCLTEVVLIDIDGETLCADGLTAGYWWPCRPAASLSLRYVT